MMRVTSVLEWSASHACALGLFESACGAGFEAVDQVVYGAFGGHLKII